MKTQIKSIISFVVMLFASITANAAGRLYIDDFSISPDETKQVAINFESDTDLAGIQAIVTLPSGLDFVDLRTENDIIDEQDPYYFVMSEKANGHEVSGAFQNNGSKVYKIMIQSTNNFVDAATARTSAIAYFKVQASADFSGQSNYIKLTEVYVSNSSGETSTKLSDTVATVSEEVVLVESVTLDKSTLSLFVGKTATLTATVLPSEAANKNITWSSTNSNIASVNASGLVTAKAAGTVTIRATAQDGSGKSASCMVTVTAPSNKFYINNFSIAAGEEKEVAILLDNNVNFTAFQAELTLPKGLEFVNMGTEESPGYFTLSDRANGHSISSAIIDSDR